MQPVSEAAIARLASPLFEFEWECAALRELGGNGEEECVSVDKEKDRTLIAVGGAPISDLLGCYYFDAISIFM